MSNAKVVWNLLVQLALLGHSCHFALCRLQSLTEKCIGKLGECCHTDRKSILSRSLVVVFRTRVRRYLVGNDLVGDHEVVSVVGGGFPVVDFGAYSRCYVDDCEGGWLW